jgi:hypothetical protein
MLFEERGKLLEPGYLPCECGYYRLSDGQMFAASLVRMPGSKGKMLEWFFSTYLRDTVTYKTWDPEAHLKFEWDDKWKPGHHIGASHYGEEWMAGEILKFRVKFYDPAKYFDVSKFKEANVGGIIVGEGFLPDGIPDGMVIHLARDTDYGCEVRSRFWIYQGSEEMGRGHMEHCLSENGHLADMLPRIYAEANPEK